MYYPRSRRMAIFGDSHLRRESTPNFGPILMKLGPIVRFTKKMTLNKCGPGLGPNYGETAHYWPENLHFFTLHPYNPHFFRSDGSDSMGSKVPHILR